MSDLPHGWVRAKIAEIAESVQSGFASGQHNRDGVGVPHLRPMNISRDGRLSLEDLRYVEGNEGHRLQRGDVLFNNTNSAELVGKTTWIEVDEELAFSNHMTRVRVCDGISPEFVARQLHHLWSRGMFQLLCNNHVSQASVSARVLSEQVELMVPPAAEQQRIVARLRELTTRSRRAKEACNVVATQLEQLRQSLLAAAFRGDLTAKWRTKQPGLASAQEFVARIRAERRRRWEAAELARMAAKGKRQSGDGWKARYQEPPSADTTGMPELPDGWAWMSLAELSWDAGYGTSEKCSYDGTGEPVLRIPNIAKGAIDLNDVKRAIRRLAVGEGELLRPGDLLVVRTNGSKDLIGRAAYLRDTGVGSFYASYLIRFRLLGDETLWRWVSACWTSRFVRARVEATAATSAGQYNISLSELSRFAIPIPPAAEQRELVRLTRAALELADSTDVRTANQCVDVATMEQSIDAKAFRGELVPQDPNDEPAAVLLERIQTARQRPRTESEDSATSKRRTRSSAETPAGTSRRRSTARVARP